MGKIDSKRREIIYYVFAGIILLLGCFLRAKLYFANDVFEDDELRLIIASANKSLIQMFMPLGDAQTAPPLFMIASKIIASIFGFSEHILKLIPFLAGIGSIYMFFIFANKYLKKKLSVLFVIYAFSVSEVMTYFATTFKQYSTDVFIGLLCLYFLPNIDITKLSVKKLLWLILIFSFLPLMSLPSVFFNLIINFKNPEFYKRVFYFVIPMLAVMLPYYFFNLIPSKIDLNQTFIGYWDKGYMDFSVSDFFRLTAENFKYYFYPNIFILFEMLLFLWGAFLCIKEKSKTSLYIVFIIMLGYIFAILHIYTFYIRIALFSVPLFLILIIKPFDSYSFKNWQIYIAIIMLCFGFCKYGLSHIKNVADENTHITWSPKILMQILKEKFNPETDTILHNNASSTSYIYYSSLYGLNTEKAYIMADSRLPEKEFIKYLDDLPKNNYIWFYMIKDYKQCQVFDYIEKWLSDKEILYSYKDKKSKLYYIHNK